MFVKFLDRIRSKQIIIRTALGVLIVLLLLFFLKISTSKSIEPSEENVEGEFQVLHFDDLKNRRSEIRYNLKTSAGNIILDFKSKKLPKIKPGSKVKVKGYSQGESFVVNEINPETPGLSTQAVTSQQKILVLLINFQNDTSQPVSVNDLRDIIFAGAGSVNNYYKETSYDQISLTGDVFGWFTIAMDNTNCDTRYGFWAATAGFNARDSGIDVASYPRKIYVFNNPPGCSFAGIGSIGPTNGSQSWIFSLLGNAGIYAHELGHNFGIYHANFLFCPGKSIDNYPNCSDNEYGDIFSVMGFLSETNGISNLFHLNSPHKAALGWISQDKIQTISSNGEYSLYPLEKIGNAPLALKIAKPDTNEAYYLEYRNPVGFDAFLPTPITKGALIHIWDGNVVDDGFPEVIKTKLIDTKPSTSTIDDAALSNGITFFDPFNNIVIQQINRDASSAKIRVNFGQITTLSCGNGFADDFSALGVNSLNWDVIGNTVIQDNGNLKINISQGGFAPLAGVQSKDMFSGDFTIEVDNSKIDPSGKDFGLAKLSIADLFGNKAFILVKRGKDGKRYLYADMFNNAVEFGPFVKSEGKSDKFKLKIRRVGNSIKTYYKKNGDKYRLLGDFTFGFNSPAFLGISGESIEFYPSVTAKFDNFSISC